MTLRELALAYVDAERRLNAEYSSNFDASLRDLWNTVQTEVNPLLAEPLTETEVMGEV